MKSLTVEVTLSDIAKGERLKPQSCPIALATLRAAKASGLVAPGQTPDVSVSRYKVIINDGTSQLRAALPRKATAFTFHFDDYSDALEFYPPLVGPRFKADPSKAKPFKMRLRFTEA